MVLDLVVQPAHEDRHRRSAADVAAHQDLAAQEVQLQLGRHQRHADVVRRERGAHVEAEDGQLHGEERDRLPRRQHAEHQTPARSAEPDGEEG